MLDLAKRVGKRVECFAMELVPGLRCFDGPIEVAEARWGVKVRRYPHWLRSVFAQQGLYRFHAADAPSLTINEIYAVARHDAGIDFIVTGAKKADSLWRRRTGALKFAKDPARLAAPIWDWSTRDVQAYLKVRGLPKPPRAASARRPRRPPTATSDLRTTTLSSSFETRTCAGRQRTRSASMMTGTSTARCSSRR